MVYSMDHKLPEAEAETLRRKLGVAKGQTTYLDSGLDFTRNADQDTLPPIAQCKD